jgi:hypothetical protein
MNQADTANLDMFESIVLSALMNGAEALPVGADDFYLPPNRATFNRLITLKDRNLLAVTAELRKHGELEKAGGEYRITEIATLTRDADSLKYALEQVLEHSRARRFRQIGQQMHNGDISPEQARKRLDEILRPVESDLPPMEDVAELIAKPIDLPPDVIQGILHRGAKMVLGGGSKTFKTWTLVDLALSVAAGTDWMGKFPTKRGRVLYINLELQGAFFANRLRVVCEESQIALESGWLTVWNLRGRAADLSKLHPLLLQQIGHERYVLIIIDPIYKLLGLRDENKAGDIASLLNEIESLAVETSAAVAFGAHYSKGNQAGKEVIDRIGGSGVFVRDPDSILNFTRHEEEDCFTVDATLRNHPPIKPFVARWKYPLMCTDSFLDPDRLKQVGAAVPQYHLTELLGLLVQPMFTGEFKERAITETGMSKATFYRLYKELKESGAVTQDAEGKWKPV